MILIAEDDSAVAELFRHLIESHEIARCHIASDVVTALQWIERVDYRLIILDIGLEGHLTGNDFLREMARRGHKMRVIITTGDPDSFEWGLYPHVKLVIEKPITDTGAFLSIVREQMKLNGEHSGANNGHEKAPRKNWLKRLWERVRH